MATKIKRSLPTSKKKFCVPESYPYAYYHNDNDVALKWEPTN